MREWFDLDFIQYNVECKIWIRNWTHDGEYLLPMIKNYKICKNCEYAASGCIAFCEVTSFFFIIVMSLLSLPCRCKKSLYINIVKWVFPEQIVPLKRQDLVNCLHLKRLHCGIIKHVAASSVLLHLLHRLKLRLGRLNLSLDHLSFRLLHLLRAEVNLEGGLHGGLLLLLHLTVAPGACRHWGESCWAQQREGQLISSSHVRLSPEESISNIFSILGDLGMCELFNELLCTSSTISSTIKSCS